MSIPLNKNIKQVTYNGTTIPLAHTLQSKSVTYTSNGSATVTPDSGYDGLSSVAVTVNVSGGGGRLPAAYQEVEYIQSTGTQYIDTEFKATNATEFSALFEITSYPDLYTTIFGVRTRVGSEGYFIGVSNSGDSYAGIGAEHYGLLSNAWDSLNTQYLVKYKNQIITCNGNHVKSFAGGSFTCSYKVCLFALNQANTIMEYGSLKLYAFKMVDDGKRVRELVPCYRKSDNEVGMYDLCTETFFTNAGTGTFLKGPDV